jgi:hypothetical protein
MLLPRIATLLISASLFSATASKAQEDPIYVNSLLKLLSLTYFDVEAPSFVIKWPDKILLRFAGSIPNPKFIPIATRIADGYADDIVPNTGLQVSVRRDETGLATIQHLLLDDPKKQLPEINPTFIPGNTESDKRAFVRKALGGLGRNGGACYFHYLGHDSGVLGYALVIIDLSASDVEVERCADVSFMATSGFRQSSVVGIALHSSLAVMAKPITGISEADKHMLRLIYQSGVVTPGMRKDDALGAIRRTLLPKKN